MCGLGNEPNLRDKKAIQTVFLDFQLHRTQRNQIPHSVQTLEPRPTPRRTFF